VIQHQADRPLVPVEENLFVVLLMVAHLSHELSSPANFVRVRPAMSAPAQQPRNINNP
jgi:hypothetical protein